MMAQSPDNVTFYFEMYSDMFDCIMYPPHELSEEQWKTIAEFIGRMVIKEIQDMG